MQVEELMTRQVQSCRPDDSLERAAQLMWENDCGCIPVCRGNGVTRAAGVITDRDICMHAFFQGRFDPLRAFGNVCSAALKERFLRLV